MKKIFINQKNDLRSGWKLLLVTIITVVLTIIFTYIWNLLGWGGGSLTLFAAMVVSVMIMLRFIDNKGINYLGLFISKESIKYLFIGLLSGVIAIILNVIVLEIFDLTIFVNKLTEPVFSYSLLKGLLIYIIVGFAEELLFRGYYIKSLQHIDRWWLFLIIPAAVFALVHGLNSNVSYLAVLNIFLAGILLGYIFIKSNNIFLPIGFHITWNYVQGYIFGISVSGGNRVEDSMYTVLINDNQLAGGAFGLEGGLINTFILLFSILIFYIYFNYSRKKDVSVTY